MPQPFDAMMLAAANEFETEAANSSRSDLASELRNDVTAQM